MPCACVQDIPSYPQNDEWGPPLWKVLHSLAEQAGRQGPYTRDDEKRAWPLFVKTLGTIIPCPSCREHYVSWVTDHPFEPPLEYNAWRMYIPLWFYTFHESVNERLAKPSVPYGELSKLYTDGSIIKKNFPILEIVVMRAIKVGSYHSGNVTLLGWQAWVKQLKMLRSVFGI